MIESSFALLKALRSYGLLEGKPSWWWAGAGSFEVVLGAILVQNTQWSKVETMLDSMSKVGILSGDCQKDLESMVRVDSMILQSHIIGLQRQKSSYIIQLSHAIMADFGDFESFKNNVDFEWLITQKGIGRESAYAILNYACEREVMVVDRYTHKLLCALGWEIEDYEELRAFCESGVRENLSSVYALYAQDKHLQDMSLAQIFARFHGKIVEFSKLKCDIKTLKDKIIFGES
ncbi:3-methyladenine DNA glycosylase [Helicobacter sp. MIT 21-1697]|uniref:3-methyladenine DNA glycosylase n=1 Tax=Helicobacter sp. MIT 21-1697 TaxID=2993733 RepID=UPI00224B5E19|nr:3-methyladenine DNA glycosylase [Helicobacter sp. MIT 21-1697]MCX2716582.1 3-methyladenine DNA glycosylase [Helicobacter sp. MIT 21-1697]